MSFGNEMRDFVNALRVGASLTKSPDEKREEEEKQKDREITRKLKQSQADYYAYLSAGKTSGEFDAKGAWERLTKQQAERRRGEAATAPPAPEVTAAIDAHVPEPMRAFARGISAAEDPTGTATNPNSGASGAYQFIPSTAKLYGLKDPKDPAAASKAFIQLTTDNYMALKQKLGRAPTWSELAVAHQQGADGAANLILGRGSITGNAATWNKLDPKAGGGAQLAAIKRYYAKHGIPDDVAVPYEKTAIPDETQPASAYANGGKVERYAGGGAAESDEDEDDPSSAIDPDKQAGRRAAGAAPNVTGGVTLPDIIHGGLSFLQGMYGLGQQNGALPTPESGARQASSARAFSSSDGAAKPEEVQQAAKMLDPGGRLDAAQVNLQVLKEGYEHYLLRGNQQKADAYAASFIKYARIQSAEYADAALKALQSGDMQAAAKLAERAYGVIPNGRDVAITLEEGQPVYTLKDANGQVVERGTFSPQQFIGAAMRMRDGTAFYDSLMQGLGGKAAGKPQAPPTQAFNTAAKQLDDARAAPRSSPLDDEAPIGSTLPDFRSVEPGDEVGTADQLQRRGAIPLVTNEQLGKMTPAERKIILDAQKKLETLSAEAKPSKADGGKAPTMSDRGKTEDVIGNALTSYANADEKAAGMRNFTPIDRTAVADTATHLMTLNKDMTSNEAVDAAAKLTRVNVKDPDATRGFTTRQNDDGTFTVKLENNKRFNMTREHLEAALTVRERAQSEVRKKAASGDGFDWAGYGRSALHAAGAPLRGARDAVNTITTDPLGAYYAPGRKAGELAIKAGRTAKRAIDTAIPAIKDFGDTLMSDK